MRLPRVGFTVWRLMIALAILIVCALAVGTVEGIAAFTAEAVALVFGLSYGAEVGLTLVIVLRSFRHRPRLQPHTVPLIVAVLVVMAVGTVEFPFIRGWALHARLERYYHEDRTDERQTAFHHQLRQKYQRAMFHPWKPIPPQDRKGWN